MRHPAKSHLLRQRYVTGRQARQTWRQTAQWLKTFTAIICLCVLPALGTIPAPVGAQPNSAATIALLPLTVHPETPQTKSVAAQFLNTIKQELIAQGISLADRSAANVVPAAMIDAPPQSKKTWAANQGADHVIWGSLTALGDYFSLDISLAPTTPGAATQYFFAEGPSIENLAEAANTITNNIRAAVFHKQRVADIIIKDNQRLEEEAIKRVITTVPGDIYSPEKLALDLKAVYAMGYFEDVRIEAKGTPAGKTIFFIVQERPTLRNILIENNKLYSDEKIQEEMTIKRGAIINLVEINMNIKNIEQMYKEKNYHNIHIAYNILPCENNQADLELTIDRGKKFLIKQIIFEGNTPPDKKTELLSWLTGSDDGITSDDTLGDIIKTSEKGFFSWLTSSGNLKMDELQQDAGRLAAHYHNNGYIDAKIADPEIETREEWLYVTFKIEEGRRFKVGDINITGDLLKSKQDLTQMLKIVPGDYFNRSLVRQDMLALNDLYADQGYFYTDIIPQTEKDLEQQTVDINYAIKKGGLVYFNDIIITGNTKTRDKVIRRELDVYEQELFSGKRLKKSIYRLYRLNYFDPAQMKVDTVETGDDNTIDLKIEVAEKPTGTLSFGGGYSSSEDLFAMASISQQNLFGRGQILQLQAEVGGTSTQYKLSFTEPWLFDIPLSAGFDMYDWEVDYDTYDSTATGGGLRFGYPIFDNTRLYLSNTYEKNRITNTSIFTPESIRMADNTSVTSSLSSSLRYDTRNRVINPSKGSNHRFTVEKAGGLLGGDVAFTKYTTEVAWYVPLFWKFVGLLHSEGGYVTENSGGYLPDYERFYLGGINSLRGFDWRGINLKEDEDGDGVITERGGDKYIQFNVEFLVPLFDENIGLVGLLFADAGNVYSKNDDIKYGTLRESTGFGIRWNSPMGPIRLERGYILDPQNDESSSGRWEFTMGAAF